MIKFHAKLWMPKFRTHSFQNSFKPTDSSTSQFNPTIHLSSPTKTSPLNPFSSIPSIFSLAHEFGARVKARNRYLTTAPRPLYPQRKNGTVRLYIPTWNPRNRRAISGMKRKLKRRAKQRDEGVNFEITRAEASRSSRLLCSYTGTARVLYMTFAPFKTLCGGKMRECCADRALDNGRVCVG